MSNYLLPIALVVLLAVAFAVAMLWQRSRPLALVLAIGVPLAAAGYFAWRGVPVAPAPVAAEADPASAETPPATDAPPAAQDAEELYRTAMADVDARIAADPEAFDAWAMKGNIHMQRQEFAEAREAFKRAHELMPEDDVVAVAYAEAMLRTAPNLEMPAEALALFERAANATPPDERAIYFVGMHRMQTGRPGEAADLWESLLPRLPPESAEHLRPQIEAARAAAARQAGQPVAMAGPAIAVSVDVAPALKARAAPGSVLYVFARAAGGGPPVAVERVVVAQWPVSVRLDDADNAMPTAKLSAQSRVEVSARLAHAGDAMAASGDLEAEPVATAVPGDAPVALVLAKVRP